MNRTRTPRSVARLRYVLRQLPLERGTAPLRIAYRVLLLVAAAAAIDFVLPRQSTPDLPVVEEGMVVGEDIIADYDFPVYKSETDLARERAEAASSVPAIFQLHTEIADSAMASAAAFFGAVEQAATGAAPDERRSSVQAVLAEYRITASDAQLALLADRSSRRQLAAAVTSAFRRWLRRGVVASAELGAGASGAVVLRADSDERLVPRDSLVTMQAFYERATSAAPGALGVTGLGLYQQLLIRFAEPTIRLDRETTETARAQARQAVDPVRYQVLEGERIMPAHERVGPEHLERLRAYRDRLTQLGMSDGGEAPLGPRLGSLLFNLLLLVVYGLLLRFFRPEIWESNRSITLVWLLLLIVSGVAGLIARTDAPAELIPVAFAALTLATLYDGLLALVTVFVLVALLVGRPPLLSMTILFYTVIGGSAAALSGRVVKRRAQTWSVVAVIAIAYTLAALSLALILRFDAGWVATAAGWGTLNAVACTLLAMGIMPVAESLTEITTDQTLLELADLNRPVLRRMSLEAPGTYAHSINVANLAEAAAREIGANALLARVGVYYHDIGKLKKPQYFVENQPRGQNPHDKLKPGTSANIVREHVEEGLELADEAGLPEVVKRFVTEHHGTQRIGFFLEKARELEPEAELDPADFRYPGPEPRSKETAIALMADSVESAARALQDPTPERITELVDRIVAAKMDEGQLAHAPLTLQEISAIKEQFVKVLTGMYHHRIDYPSAEEQPPKSEETVAPGTG